MSLAFPQSHRQYSRQNCRILNEKLTFSLHFHNACEMEAFRFICSTDSRPAHPPRVPKYPFGTQNDIVLSHFAYRYSITDSDRRQYRNSYNFLTFMLSAAECFPVAPQGSKRGKYFGSVCNRHGWMAYPVMLF